MAVYATRNGQRQPGAPSGDGHVTQRAAISLCVPKTSSTSHDQAVFVDQATDVSLFPDAVLVEIDRLG
jgi:hypothetical protein